MDLVPLLQALVAIDSTSDRGRTGRCWTCSSARPGRPGSRPAGRTWLDAAGVEKANLVCRRGPDAAGGLALVGHTDCVPYDEDWKEALSGEVRDGRVHGRGAADTKAFLAAALAAVARARPASGRRSRWPSPPTRRWAASARSSSWPRGASTRATPSWASRPAWCRCARTRATARWRCGSPAWRGTAPTPTSAPRPSTRWGGSGPSWRRSAPQLARELDPDFSPALLHLERRGDRGRQGPQHHRRRVPLLLRVAPAARPGPAPRAAARWRRRWTGSARRAAAGSGPRSPRCAPTRPR